MKIKELLLLLLVCLQFLSCSDDEKREELQKDYILESLKTNLEYERTVHGEGMMYKYTAVHKEITSGYMYYKIYIGDKQIFKKGNGFPIYYDTFASDISIYSEYKLSNISLEIDYYYSHDYDYDSPEEIIEDIDYSEIFDYSQFSILTFENYDEYYASEIYEQLDDHTKFYTIATGGYHEVHEVTSVESVIIGRAVNQYDHQIRKQHYIYYKPKEYYYRGYAYVGKTRYRLDELKTNSTYRPTYTHEVSCVVNGWQETSPLQGQYAYFYNYGKLKYKIKIKN